MTDYDRHDHSALIRSGINRPAIHPARRPLSFLAFLIISKAWRRVMRMVSFLADRERGSERASGVQACFSWDGIVAFSSRAGVVGQGGLVSLLLLERGGGDRATTSNGVYPGRWVEDREAFAKEWSLLLPHHMFLLLPAPSIAASVFIQWNPLG